MAYEFKLCPKCDNVPLVETAECGGYSAYCEECNDVEGSFGVHGVTLELASLAWAALCDEFCATHQLVNGEWLTHEQADEELGL